MLPHVAQVDGGAEVLRASGLQRSFAGVQALRNGSLCLRAGEIHALVGENGAGKSTLIRIIAGAIDPDGGELWIGDQLVREFSPQHARALGVSVIYQQPALFPTLTVAENLALGLEPPGLWRRVDRAARQRQARELLDRVGASIDPTELVGGMTLPQQQLVEIARALGQSSRILILDEPTAALSDREVAGLFAVLTELRRQGIAIVYISHRMEEIFTLADRITVLRDGETLGTLDRAEADQQRLIAMMVGRELATVFPARPEEAVGGETILRVEQLRSRAVGLREVSLELKAGEILGIAGLVGSGRSELARTIFGLHPVDGGRLFVRAPGGELQPASISDPAAAVAAGIAYVPEDRRRHGVIPELSVAANSTLAVLSRVSESGLIDRSAEMELAAQLATRLRLKAESLFVPAASLSGGNQQKVALSRWLATNPRILILDEPTQGIDVAAKAEIHLYMRDLTRQGIGIILISSELPEILGMSDRIVVMRQGRSVALLSASEATPESVIRIAFGQDASG